MATKTIKATGGDYATPQLWVSYVAALTTLSAPEIGEMAAEEFNSGSLSMTGGTVVASGTNQIILRCQTGAQFDGDPLRYGEGARILFDGSEEQAIIEWNHTVIQGVSFKGTGALTLAGRLRVSYNITVAVQNVLIECNQASNVFDDRGAAAGLRENCLFIRVGGNSSGGVRCANFNKTYKNCTSVALNSPTSSIGWTTAYATPIYINCVSYGYSTDYHATWNSGSSKNCATDKTSGASNIASMTGAQFSVASGDFVSVSNGTHDLRVASGSTKLKDLGAASGGTTTDILGNAISGGTRDIGAHEYQAAASGLAANPIFGGGAAALPLGGYVA